jgi:chitinase
MTYPTHGLVGYDDELKAYIDSQDQALQAQVSANTAGLANLKLPAFTTAGRPSASSRGAGSVIWDSTLKIPLVSDGTSWLTTNGATPPVTTGVPTAPNNFTVVAATNGTTAKATLTWSAPTSNGGSAITSYTATRNPGSVTQANATSGVVLTGLTYATAYTFTVAALNANGTGAASTVTVTMPANPGSGSPALPAKIVGGWWTYWDGPALASVNAAYDVIYCAFALGQNTTSGTLVFTPADGGIQTDASFKADVLTKQAAGKKIFLSMGGQDDLATGGAGYRMNSTARVSQAVTSVQVLITAYNFDGIDVEFENGTVTTDASFWLSFVSQLKAWKPTLLIAVNGAGGYTGNTAYFKFMADLGASMDIAGPQFYDDPTITNAATLSARVTEVFAVMTGAPYNLPASKLLIGVSTEAGSTNYASAGNAAGMVSTWNTQETARPTLRGMNTWDIPGDVSRGNPFATTVATAVH